MSKHFVPENLHSAVVHLQYVIEGKLILCKPKNFSTAISLSQIPGKGDQLLYYLSGFNGAGLVSANRVLKHLRKKPCLDKIPFAARRYRAAPLDRGVGVHVEGVSQDSAVLAFRQDLEMVVPIETFWTSKTKLQHLTGAKTFYHITDRPMPPEAPTPRGAIKEHRRPHGSGPKPVMVGGERVEQDSHIQGSGGNFAFVNVENLHGVITSRRSRRPTPGIARTQPRPYGTSGECRRVMPAWL